MEFTELLTQTTPLSSAHDRLLEAAKILFANRGYEKTTTQAIAKLARTSESQLVKHFGGKEGLLEGVFEQGWLRIMRNFPELNGVASPLERLGAVADTVITVMENDQALKYLFLFEGRRFRSNGESFLLTAGYLKLVTLLDSLIEELAASGQLSRKISTEAVRSALIGSIEGLLRDHAMGQRIGFPASYNVNDIKRVFRMMLAAFTPPERRPKLTR
jgi:AcrR family transcriptional regulator